MDYIKQHNLSVKIKWWVLALPYSLALVLGQIDQYQSASNQHQNNNPSFITEAKCMKVCRGGWSGLCSSDIFTHFAMHIMLSHHAHTWFGSLNYKLCFEHSQYYLHDSDMHSGNCIMHLYKIVTIIKEWETLLKLPHFEGLTRDELFLNM